FKGLVDELVSGPGEDALADMCGKKGGPFVSGVGFDYSALCLSRYLSPGTVLPYSTARGCYWKRCTFCPEKTEKGGYLSFNAKTVINDIQRLVKKTRPRLIHFLDNALSPGFLNQLIKNPPGVSWYGFTRITEHLTDTSFVNGLKSSGCVMLKLGIESGDQMVLDSLEKGIDLNTVSLALNTLKDASISIYAYLLFGTPSENLKSARKPLILH
ncbi:B12-binding domain-containing radical SAM protein, partial [Thermodesulfobacteriota bacterium]